MLLCGGRLQFWNMGVFDAFIESLDCGFDGGEEYDWKAKGGLWAEFSEWNEILHVYEF
jgi:hypothetical protein